MKHVARRKRRAASPDGAVAQLGERRLCKPKVAGSIPVSSTINQTPYFPERGDGLLLLFLSHFKNSETDTVSVSFLGGFLMRLPKLRRQKLRNRAFVEYDGKRIYLGRWGDTTTKANYRAFINEITAPVPQVKEDDPPPTVADLALFFLKARANYYVKDGRQTGQLARYKAALEFPLKLYPSTPVDDFGPRKLIVCRNAMEESGRFARSYVNTLINCFRTVYRWGVENELVKPETLTALETVSGLKRRRSIAREVEPVKPVPLEDVRKTMEALPATLCAMIELQILTGMRPGEVCAMRAGDVAEADNGLLVYTLRTDKTDYRRSAANKKRIPLGPKARRVVVPYLDRDADEFLFTPKEAQFDRAFTSGKRPTRAKYNDSYNTSAYARAISRAAKKVGAAHWSPNQLRHLYASEIRRKYGLEAAQLMLCHAKADVTQIYAERDLKRMEEIAAKEG